MKVLSIQDIACYGQCSNTVALPILSHFGIETVILPSAILSTHTAGFAGYTNLDLTDEMKKIVNHWEKEGIRFDAIYTGYIGNARQFPLILRIKKNLLKPNGLFIVDPAMADHGKLYPALDEDIVDGMRSLVQEADLIFPNITEACLLTGSEYQNEQDEESNNLLIQKLVSLGAKKIVLTSVQYDEKIGAMVYDGGSVKTILKEKDPCNYHGSGDIFASVTIGKYLSTGDLLKATDTACAFILEAIRLTKKDEQHSYGLHFEALLKNL